MSAAAETIGNQLIDKVNLAFSNGRVNDFVIASLKKEAANLLQVEPVEAYTVLGAIECVCGNREKMLENHRKALRLSNDNIFALTNFSTSLTNSWMLDEQLELLTDMEKREISLDQTLVQLGYNRALVGDYESAFKAAQRYFNLIGEDEHLGRHLMETILIAHDFIQSNDLNIDEVSKYCELMNQAMVTNNYAPSFLDVWLTPEENIVRDVLIEIDDSELSKLNEDFFELLANTQFSDQFYSKFSGSFIFLD